MLALAMQVQFGVELLEAEWTSSVACIGTFDGVHLGHQAVIERAVNAAREVESPCVLITFDRHPAHVLAPERCPKAIASLDENLAQFERLGVALAVVLAFDKRLSETSAQDFFEHVLIERARASKIVVGYDFAFGHGREGTPDWLRQRIETVIEPPFELEGRRVSSTAIRAAVQAGHMEDAEHLLGRAFAISGVVVGGQRLGRQLGYPTLNLARSFDQVQPADGVYKGICRTPHGTFRAAVSIGMRPAVGGTHRTVEAYLIDYPGHSLYGRSVSLQLTKRIRDELPFESLDALKRQMAEDIAEAAALP